MLHDMMDYNYKSRFNFKDLLQKYFKINIFDHFMSDPTSLKVKLYHFLYIAIFESSLTYFINIL